MNIQEVADAIAVAKESSTYVEETQFIHEQAQDADSSYLWRRLCTMLNACQYAMNSSFCKDQGTATARWLAIGDWMNRIHDTADGHICVFDAVPVPEDYPFAR